MKRPPHPHHRDAGKGRGKLLFKLNTKYPESKLAIVALHPRLNSRYEKTTVDLPSGKILNMSG
mgnify:CR=1 FL=1